MADLYGRQSRICTIGLLASSVHVLRPRPLVSRSCTGFVTTDRILGATVVSLIVVTGCDIGGEHGLCRPWDRRVAKPVTWSPWSRLQLPHRESAIHLLCIVVMAQVGRTPRDACRHRPSFTSLVTILNSATIRLHCIGSMHAVGLCDLASSREYYWMIQAV